MGRFVNPDNSAFQVAVASEIYIDKTGMLAYTNKVLGTKQALICNSRPRRFGKSTTADMLTAYYSRGADSKKLFAGYEISNDKNFSKYLNKYDVIHLDIQWCMMDAGSAENTVSYINKNVIGELKKLYPEIEFADVQHLYGALSKINAALKQKFIIIIDEWDVLVRDEATNTAVQEEYINFLRGLFKGAEPEKYLALAYLTGILPIKKIKTQSALNNFEEFTMLAPGGLASYFGFTEAEVQGLCAKYNVDFTEVKRWYDGYFLGNEHIYNPKAVVSVMLRKEF
nr:AAA family ATPase [Phascolarctobacterium succinatutens]